VSAVTGTGEGAAARRELLPLPTPAKLLFVGAVAAALAGAAAAFSSFDADGRSWLVFAALATAGAAGHLFVVRTGKNHGFHTGIVFLAAGTVLLPPELVVLLGIAPFLPEWLKERYPWYIGTFNLGNFVLGGVAAWGAAHVVRVVSPGPNEFAFALGGLAAAVVFVVLNHLLLASMLKLGRGHSFRDSGLLSVAGLAPDVVLATLGVALAAMWNENPWILPAAIAPLVWSHRSFATVALLRESEERFRAMFEVAPVGARMLDLERRTIASNRALERMLGYSSAELAAMAPAEYTRPEDEALERELFAELVAARREHYELEKQYTARDGRTVWGHVAASLIRDADGRPKFGIAMIEDTTEQKLAEESLRQSEERYRELFENANDMVFALDLEGRFTAINRAGERITGFRRAELLGRPMRELLADPGCDLFPSEGDESAYECELVAADGRRVPLEVASRLTRVGGQTDGVQGVARDVSERQALEEQLRQAQKMEAVGQLAGGIAHDFNNLLTAISGYSEFALGRVDGGDPKLRSNITEIKRSAERASALTRQLLAFSRKQILQPRLLRPDELVGGLDELLRRLIGTHIEILTVSRPGLGFVRADPGQLEQVIVNLVVNARDAILRAVLHHEGAGQGHRAGARDRLRHRPAERRLRRRRERGRHRLDVPRLPAAARGPAGGRRGAGGRRPRRPRRGLRDGAARGGRGGRAQPATRGPGDDRLRGARGRRRRRRARGRRRTRGRDRPAADRRRHAEDERPRPGRALPRRPAADEGALHVRLQRRDRRQGRARAGHRVHSEAVHVRGAHAEGPQRARRRRLAGIGETPTDTAYAARRCLDRWLSLRSS
jgi:PAS domain S-box-containing protein